MRPLTRRQVRSFHRRSLWLNRLEDRLAPAILNVTSAGDSGAGTLRQAILTANTNNQADTITFDAAITSINLTSGQLSIDTDANDLNVVGPGSGKLSIAGQAAAGANNRLFNIGVTGSVAKVSLSGLTLMNGNLSAGNNGGAILVADEQLNLNDIVLANNKTASLGGAIHVGGGTVLNVSSSVLTQNRSGGHGAAILVAGSTTLSITNTLVADNIANGWGGGLFVNGNSKVTISQSTFSDNFAQGGGGVLLESGFTHDLLIDSSTFQGNIASLYSGGGVYVSAGNVAIRDSSIVFNLAETRGGGLFVETATTNITNTTIAQNQVKESGGGIYIHNNGVLNVANCSIVHNSRTSFFGGGAGIYSSSTVTLSSTVVAANSSPIGPSDIYRPSFNPVGGNNNLVGVGDDGNILLIGTGNQAGTRAIPLEPQLTPFPAYYGGLTPSIAPRSGSPVLDNGNNDSSLSFDQRGSGNPRTVGKTDVGAVEGAISSPYVLAASFTDVITAGASNYLLSITFDDKIGIDTAAGKLNTGDLEIVGPSGSLIPSFVGFASAGGSRITASYSLAIPGSAWDPLDNGRYVVRLKANEVFNTDAVPTAAAATLLGYFTVNVGNVITVDSTSDVNDGNYSAGQLSLREAVGLANTTAGIIETIRFAPGMTGQTILLSSQLQITDRIAIVGPGMDSLTISGKSANRVFWFTITGLGPQSFVSGMTLTRGLDTGGGGGGAIRLDDDSLQLLDVRINETNNPLSASGGRFWISDSVISNSFASAISLKNSSSLELTRSTIANNSGIRGGGISAEGGYVRISDSTIMDNQASMFGGGIYAKFGTTSIVNSTITGNTAVNFGGGIGVYYAGVVSLENTTVTRNSSDGFGGGIFVPRLGRLILNNSIVAQNSNATDPDLLLGAIGSETPTLDGTNNLIGVLQSSSINIVGTYQAGTLAAPLNPKLTSLSEFGGPTLTYALLPGSPAIDKGSVANASMFDQRGTGFVRILGSAPDLGSFEGVMSAPYAQVNLSNVTTGGGTTYSAVVTYFDSDGIDVSSIDVSDVVLTGLGYGVPAAATAVKVAGSGTSVTATYEFAAPGGTWDPTDNSQKYTLRLLSGAISDLAPVPESSFASNIGHFAVQIPKTFVVDTSLDVINAGDGKTSLREAIIAATQDSLPQSAINKVVFDSGLNGQTITLSGTEISITFPINILGPGSNLLTISGNNKSRIFAFNIVGPGFESQISGLTLTQGKSSGTGGAISLGDDQLVLSNVIVSNSVATTTGGAIDANNGKLTITDSLIQSNSAGSYGGGIHLTGGQNQITRTTIDQNKVLLGGGGLRIDSGTVTVRDSTISRNAVTYPSFGGAGMAMTTGDVTLINTTISSNTAPISKSVGGGINITAAGKLTVFNSTITKNQATYGGGIEAFSSAVTISLDSTIIAQNIAVTDPDLSTAKTTILGNNNLFGAITDTDTTLAGSFQGGTLAGPLNPRLSPLVDFGGPMQTHGLLFSSPAIDNGSNLLSLSNDQRGVGFPRSIGTTDIGATEGIYPFPSGLALLPGVSIAWGTTYFATVEYEDQSGIDTSTIDTSDVTLRGPNISVPLSPISATFEVMGARVIAKYTFVPPGGFWDSSENGTFTLEQQPGQVFDFDSPVPRAALGGALADFAVLVPTQYVVDLNTDNDDKNYGPGQLNLREAILLSNQSIGLVDTITFNTAAFPGNQASLSSPVKISESVCIQGPATPFSIAAGGQLFDVYGPQTVDLYIDNLTLTNNRANYDEGGAIESFGENIYLNNVTLSGNDSRDYGGGIHAVYGSVSLTNCLVTGNLNAAIFVSSAPLVIRNSTISGNLDVGFRISSGATVLVENCTITGNGDYAFLTTSSGGAVQLISTVVAGNDTASATPSADFNGQNITAINSAIGIAPTTGFTQIGGFAGTSKSPFNPMLAPLHDNGGRSNTVAPLPGSPLIDAGSNPSSLTFDQRGVGYPRVINGKTDIGAFEGVSEVPLASATPFSSVLVDGGTSYSFSVTYTDPTGINIATLGAGDITVTGPNSFKATATFDSVDINSNGTPRTATYSFVPPGGKWDKVDNGSYTVTLNANQVGDIDAKTNFVLPKTLGTIFVKAASIFTVDNTGDANDGKYTPGELTLREAILLANQNTSLTDTVTFDPAVFAGITTITLANGALSITDPVSIQGPAGGMVINAAGKSRAVTISSATFDRVTLERMTLINGNATASDGGGIQVVQGWLTLRNVNISQCTAGTHGGAINLNASGDLEATDCSFVDNKAQNGAGGAISSTGSLIQLLRCAMANNLSTGNGGGISTTSHVTVDNCAVINNTIDPTKSGSGGGIYLASTTGTQRILTLRNSTVSGNTAGLLGSGGGVFVRRDIAIIQNTTVAFNNAPVMGGGISLVGGATATLDSTIVSDNSASMGPDISGAVQGTFSLISSSTGASISGTGHLVGVAARLMPLANNGGPTLTHLPMAGSPVRNAGSNPLLLSVDQRGIGFARELGGRADIGAVESNDATPVATVQLTDVLTTGAGQYSFSVAYRSDSGIDVSTIGTGDLTVNGPNGFVVIPTLLSIDQPTNGSPRIATYSFTPPNGTWSADDFGSYSVTLAANEVSDVAIPAVTVPGAMLGGFQVMPPLQLVVDEVSDINDGDYSTGKLSLREAVILANRATTHDTIGFSPATFASATTIKLTSALPIRSAVTIDGLGLDLIIIDAGKLDRILTIDIPSPVSQLVSISGLRLTGGKTTDDGGAIFSQSSQLSLSYLQVDGNAGAFGGALAVVQGSANINRVNFLSNSASKSGGAVYLSSTSALIQESSLASNTAAESGGGVYGNSSQLTVRGSTFELNTAIGDGGGLRQGNAGVLISNTTFSGNKAANGGGLWLSSSSSAEQRIESTTITGNSATTKGGGVYRNSSSGTFAITSSVIAKNTNASYPDIRSANSLLLTWSAVGIDSFSEVTGSGNNRPFGEDFKLGSLASNGGATKTHLPAADSPLVDHGNNAAGLTTDQRGQTRQSGRAPDIGSVEIVSNYPWGQLSPLTDIGTPGGTSYEVNVKWNDNAGIQVASLGNGDLRLSGPGGFSITATFLSVDVNTDGTPRSAKYAFTPPNGTWDAYDNGAYTVSIEPNQIANTSGQFAEALTLGSFNVAMAGIFVVNTNADSGPGSLRDAVARSNTGSFVDTIIFDPNYFNVPRTILLTGGSLAFINVMDEVSIIGPGSGLATIQGNYSVGIFRNFSNENFSLTGLTLTRGKSTGTSGFGGAIYSQGGDITLTDCVFYDNVGSKGAAVALDSKGLLVANQCMWILNDGTSSGGAVYLAGTASAFIRDSSFQKNDASQGGGIYLSGSGNLEIYSSTFSGNTASEGAGVRGVGNGQIFLRNSTLSGNKSTVGGAISLSGTAGLAPALTIENCTIVSNQATSAGGVYAAFPAVIRSSVIANNQATTNPDLEAVSVVITHSAIGSSQGYTFGLGSGNNLPTGIDVKLAPMANNGGLTETHAPLPGSPLMNAGSNPSGLLVDQRGFPRVHGGVADIGAMENVRPAPQAIPNLPSMVVQGGTTYSFSVTYHDDIAISSSSIDSNDVRVTGPNGFNVLATLVSINDSSDGTPRTANYGFTAPGGFWDFADDGLFTVTLEKVQIFDTTLIAAPAIALGTFSVNFPQSLLVTTDADDGPGSLRAIVAQANVIGSTDLITFDPIFFVTPRTIVLTSGQILVSDHVTIAGPGASLLTISGNKNSRIIQLDGPGTITLSVSGITFANGTMAGGGFFDNGGAINSKNDQVIVSSCVFVGNSASYGGAISVDQGPGLTISDSRFEDNVALKFDGGAVSVGSAQNLTIHRSSFVNNSALRFGGAIVMLNPTITNPAFLLSDSLLTGNASSHGAGLYLGGYWISSPVVKNTTISANAATHGGGGISFNISSTLLVQNSTIVGNSVETVTSGNLGGGGINRTQFSGDLRLESTIVANNTSPVVPDVATQEPFIAIHSAIGSGIAIQYAAGSHSNLPFGIDLKLGLLDDYGGPTLTHELAIDSPCINAGLNASGLLNDQRGPGFARTIGSGTDIGAFESQDAKFKTLPPPTANVVVNDGSTQRSQVNKLVITFNQPVNFPNGFASAFRLVRTGPAGTVGQVNGAFTQTGNTVTMTFLDPTFSPFGGGLVDGRYVLTLNAADINGGKFDGNGDGIAGDNGQATFHRLFGDADGNATVNAIDFAAFRSVFGVGTSMFDYNADGSTNASDFAQFRSRFGITLAP